MSLIKRVVLEIMKTHYKTLIAATGFALLLTGCCTNRHATAWEYKRTYPTVAAGTNLSLFELREAWLNDMGKQGWDLVLKEDETLYIFKRPLK